MKYIELALNRASHQGLVIPLQDLPIHLRKAQQLEAEVFRSIFSFDEKIKEHMQSGRLSPSGYIYNYYLDNIVFDIDKGKESDASTFYRAKLFIEILIEDWYLDEDTIQIWHSGSGYHIVIPDIFGFEPSPSLPGIVKSTLEKYFTQVDTSFYTPTGLIRVGYSINHKTGRYKTPFTYEEFMSFPLEKIFEIASNPRMDLKFTPIQCDPMYNDLIVKEKKPINIIQMKQDVTSKVTCVQAMYQRGEEKGTRHNRIMAITSAWKREGIPKDAIIAAMKAYAPSLDSYEVEKYVTDVFAKGYSFGCESPEMKKFCSDKCMFFKHKNYAPQSISSGATLEQELREFYQTDFSSSAFDFQTIFDIKKPFVVYPGFFGMIIGATGLNKTALAQNIAARLKTYSPVLYLSTEFGDKLLYRRFVQIEYGLTKEEVVEGLRSGHSYLSRLDHIHYVRVTPNLTEIASIIDKTNPKIVFIDTLDDIPVPGMPRGTKSEEELASRLKSIAETSGTIIIGVHHINKSGAVDFSKSKPTQRALDLYASKGSAAFIQKTDFVLGIEGDRTDTLRTLTSLKGRDDEPFRITFDVDMDTFQFNRTGNSGWKIPDITSSGLLEMEQISESL